MKGKNTLFLVLFTLVLGLFALGGCSTSDAWRTRLSSGPVTYEQVDVAYMQKEIGIDEVLLAWAFGVPKTAEEKQTYESLASMLAAAKTFREAQSVYVVAPSESEVGKAAFQKMFSLATTADEWDMVYRDAPSGRETEEIAQMKRDALRKASLEYLLAAAKTFREAQNVYAIAPSGSKVEKAAIEKMLTFATTLAEVRFVFQIAARGGTEMQKKALRRLAEFYKKEQKK